MYCDFGKVLAKFLEGFFGECSRSFGELSGGVLVVFWRILEASASFLEKVLKISASFGKGLGCFGECSRSFVELLKPTIDA